MTSLTFYGGVRELGGNQILLEDQGTKFFLDFGINFTRLGKYFRFPNAPKKFNAINVYLDLGIYPDMKGIYRQDYLRRVGRELGERSVDAVVVSHAHLDHAAGVHFLRPDIDVWMDRHTKRILYALQTTSGDPFHEFLEFKYSFAYGQSVKNNDKVSLTGRDVTFPRPVKLFEPNQPFRIGNIEIEPYYVDHSIPGSCAFIIHTSAGPVVYTADIRMRGRRKGDTERFIEAAAQCRPAYLLCEGSLIDKRHVGDEEAVVRKTYEFIKGRNGLILFTYPPRDLDRLTSFYKVARKSGRTLVIPSRQAFLLDLFNGEFKYPKTTHKYIGIFLPRKVSGSLDMIDGQPWERDYFEWERQYINHSNRISVDDIRRNPGSYILYISSGSLDDLVELEPPEDSVFIRSTPEPYTEEMELDETLLINWLERFGVTYKGHQMNLLYDNSNSEESQMNFFDEIKAVNSQPKLPMAHVTGHMSLEETAEMINRIKPKVLIPIHTLYPEWFSRIYNGDVKIVESNETVEL